MTIDEFAIVRRIENEVAKPELNNPSASDSHSIPDDLGQPKGGTDDGLTCLLAIGDVGQALGMSARQVKKLWDAGLLPDPIYVGGEPAWQDLVIQALSRRQNMKGARE